MDATTNGHQNDRAQADHLLNNPPPLDRRSKIYRWLGVGAFLVLVVFWIWVFANRGSIAHNDEFNDPTFSAAAEAICSKRQAAIAEIPLATAAKDAIERGQLLERGTAELELMVAELNDLDPPASVEGAAGVEAWLTDYEIYLDDRRRYADILATGEDPPFLISPSATQNVRVTDLLGTFAEVNRMDNCAPSGDV